MCREKKDGTIIHSTLAKSDFESFYVANIFDLYKKGYSFKQIAELLSKEHGFRRWTKSKINGIINNKTYTGKIYYQRRGGRRKGYKRYEETICSPDIENGEIINENIWDACSEARKKRSETKDAYYYLTPFILKDKLVCADCKAAMKPKNPGNNKSNVYKCGGSDENSKHKNSKYKKSIPARKVHYIFSKTIQNEFANQNYDILWDKYEKEFNFRKDKYNRFLEEISDKIKNERNFTDRIVDRLKSEENKFILDTLENQYKMSMKILKEYKKIEDEWIKKPPSKVEKDEFNEIIHKALGNVLDKFDIEDADLDEETQKINSYKVREFVINFIDSVHIQFENREIKSMRIEYKITKFL